LEGKSTSIKRNIHLKDGKSAMETVSNLPHDWNAHHLISGALSRLVENGFGGLAEQMPIIPELSLLRTMYESFGCPHLPASIIYQSLIIREPSPPLGRVA
jgi:hypothetical protein